MGKARTWSATAVACGVIALLLVAGAALAQAAPAPLVRPAKADRIDGRYIVVLEQDADTASVDRVTRTARNRGGRIDHRYRRALKGFSAELSAAALAEVRDDPAVAFVEADARVSVQATQTNPTWGLDRIDQPDLPLNATYDYHRTGDGVAAYIIDTGVRTSHAEFGGRAASGTDIIDGGAADDCHGHGTHVAGTVGGARYGVAKQVRLVAVRVLDCSGSGTHSQVAAGVDWVTADHVGTDPAVANMSLGSSGSSPTMEQAVENSIADGVTYVIAAGNSHADACGATPARVPAALTVGATDPTDARASYSNHGSCVDVFAPGSGTTSAWNGSDDQIHTISGTSMAAPHVAGVAALYLQATPSASPATVAGAVITGAVAGKVTNAGTGSPNRLVHSHLARAIPTLTTAATPDMALGGGPLSNTATVTGRANPTPGATIDFRLYGPDDAGCSRAPVFTSLDVAYPVAGGPITSAAFTPTRVGTYRWRVSYSGDANNTPADTGCAASGDVTLGRALPTIRTYPSDDTSLGAYEPLLFNGASVNGQVEPGADSTVDFRLYGPNDPDCSGTSVFESLGRRADGQDALSGVFRPSQVGTYRWRVTYSGDANNHAVDGGCRDPVHVTPPTPQFPLVAGNTNPPADTSLDFRLTGSAKQKPLRNSRGLAVKLSCPQEACVVEVSGTVTVPARTAGKKSKKYRLKRVKIALVDTKPTKLRLKLSSALRRHVARALGTKRTRNGVKVQLKATASDVASNQNTRKLTVRVRR